MDTDAKTAGGAVKYLTLLVAVILIVNISDAQELAAFKHIPPEASSQNESGQVLLVISADNIKRARILVQQTNGILVAELKKQQANNSYEVIVSFNGLAELIYSFQYETLDGKLQESQSYHLRRYSGQEYEQAIKDKIAELQALKEQLPQLENEIQALRSSDPKSLARQKNVELARAIVLLNKREREVKEAEVRQRKGS